MKKCIKRAILTRNKLETKKYKKTKNFFGLKNDESQKNSRGREYES